MKRLQSGAFAPVFLIGLAAAPCALAQSAVAAALGAPAQARVGKVTPPPTVNPSDGGLIAGGEAAVPAPGVDLRAVQILIRANARPEPVSAALIPTGLSHYRLELTTADGVVVPFDSGVAPTFMAGNGYVLNLGMNMERQVGSAMAYRFTVEEDHVKVETVYGLKSGEVIQPPAVNIPLPGGTRTVDLPQGGVLTVTLDGAHTISPSEIALAQHLLATSRPGQ